MNVNEANIAGSLCKSSIDTLAYNFDKELRLTDGFAPSQQIKVRVAETSDSLDWDGDTWTPLDGTIKEFTAQSHTWILQVMSLGTRFNDWKIPTSQYSITLNSDNYYMTDLYTQSAYELKAGSAVHVKIQLEFIDLDQSALSSEYYGLVLRRMYQDNLQDSSNIDDDNYNGILSPIKKALNEKFGDYTTHCFTPADNGTITVDEWVSIKNDVYENRAILNGVGKIATSFPTGSIRINYCSFEVSDPYHYQCIPHSALCFYETDAKQILGKTGVSGGFCGIDINTPTNDVDGDNQDQALIDCSILNNIYGNTPTTPVTSDPSIDYGYFAGYSALAPSDNYPRNETIRIITFANQMRNIDSKYSDRIIVHVPPKDGVTMDADQLSDSTITSNGALWSAWVSPLSEYDPGIICNYSISPSVDWSNFVAGRTYKVAMWLELTDNVSLYESYGYFRIQDNQVSVIGNALNTRWQEVSKLYNNPTNPQSFPNKAYYIETTVTLPSSLPSGNFQLYIATYSFTSGKFRFTIPAITLIG